MLHICVGDLIMKKYMNKYFVYNGMERVSFYDNEIIQKGEVGGVRYISSKDIVKSDIVESTKNFYYTDDMTYTDWIVYNQLLVFPNIIVDRKLNDSLLTAFSFIGDIYRQASVLYIGLYNTSNMVKNGLDIESYKLLNHFHGQIVSTADSSQVKVPIKIYPINFHAKSSHKNVSALFNSSIEVERNKLDDRTATLKNFMGV